MKVDTNLLVVSKDLVLYDSLKKITISANFNLHFCNTYEDILSYIKENNIKVGILDLDRSDEEKLQLLKRIKIFDPLIDIIIVGKSLSPEMTLPWINEGATDYLSKPLKMEAVEDVLKKIVEKVVLKRETYILEKRLEKKYTFLGMVSKNLFMLEIFALIENISKHFTSVLITGSTGTGKEMIARAIHQLSPFKKRGLVICDCTSIPENLFESELFGYVKGAFSGADKDKKGLFEEADKGVIFLDEIGEVPFSVQSKLLRVLETHQFRPLGSNENKQVDVRVIAASNRNLRENIKRAIFREDLFHRLNRVEIHLPLLRERPEDIPLLVRHFLNRCNKKYEKEIKGVSREVQKLFLRYDWPGNVREMENVLETTAMLCQKDFIDISDLPKYLQDITASAKKIPFIDRDNLSTLEGLEKEYIAYLLKTTNNNLRKTAKILGISRTTLYNKMSKYGLSRGNA